MALTRPRAYQIYDIDYKQAVRVVTISNITLSGGAPNSVDGVNLSLNDRVLVTGQTNGVQNGIYYVTTLGSGSNGTWTRSIDTDATGELLSGTIVMVTEGTAYADTQWKLTTNDPITIGVTSLTFVQNYLANSISFGQTSFTIGSSNANATVSVSAVSNVAVFAPDGEYITGLISATGNIAGGNLTISGLITATSNITSSGNISGTYFLGNGSQLTGLPATYGNSNVADYLASGTDSSNIITTGNVSGTYLLGNVFYATGITASKIYNGTSEANIGTSGGNANVSIGGTSNVVVIYSGGMSVTGDLTVTGNATLSGNILGDRIVNGTTELDIQTAGGNANLTIGGTSNVVVWTTTGEYVTGLISASGNITSAGNISGGNILGNGQNLTGINSFSTISVSGQSDVVADSITDTLTFAAGSGISITTDAGSDTITITASTSGSSIFATGGDMGTVTESVTSSEDLGLVTDAVTGTTYDLGTIGVDGVVTNDNIAFYTITGDKLANNLVYSSNLSVTGNITGGGIRSTSAATPPANPSVGDTWFNTNTGDSYRWTYDGTSYYWVDVTGPVIANAAPSTSSINQISNGNSNVNVNSLDSITLGVNNANVVVVSSGWANVTGNVSATGNISANYFNGNGSQLTGIPAAGTSNARAFGFSMIFGG